MGIQKKEVEFAKEVDDVCVLLVSLVKDLKAKKPTGELVSGNIPKLIDAVAGIDALADEASLHRSVFIGTILSRVAELADVLLPAQPKVVQAVGQA